MPDIAIRNAMPTEYSTVGDLMVSVYTGLEGFPGPDEHPHYYAMLANIGDIADRPSSRLLVAVNDEGDGESRIMGAVVYVGDMAEYRAEGKVTTLKDTSGIRLLAVDPKFRGMGIGRKLTEFCIDLARQKGHPQVALHSTEAMHVAWKMYERMGFERSEDIDMELGAVKIYGFRLLLD